jgi:hypothetical protein
VVEVWSLEVKNTKICRVYLWTGLRCSDMSVFWIFVKRFGTNFVNNYKEAPIIEMRRSPDRLSVPLHNLPPQSVLPTSTLLNGQDTN